MSDPSLEAIRAQRMAQIQGQGGDGPGVNPNPGESQQNQEEERKNQAEQMKNQILTRFLDQPARARLNTLMLAKPEKGQMIENMLINMARSGQLRDKIGETELISLLEQVSEKISKTTKVKFDRRRTNLDDDDDEFDL